MATATRTLRESRTGAVIPLVVVAILAAGVVAKGYGLYLLGLAVLIPIALLILQRPQRGVLLLAFVAPFSGLLLILPFPSFASGWKEALVGAIVVATFLCPRAARGEAGRRLPRWLPALGLLILLGLVSAARVGGSQAIEGLKINYFYLLLAIGIWRCPLNERERDHLVSILMLTGFVTSVIGLAQQFIGQTALNDLGYDYNTTIRTTGGFLRSFSTFEQPFPFALFVMLVLLIGVPVALADPQRLRNRVFLFMTPVYALGIVFAFVRAAWLGLAVGMLYLGFKRYRLLLIGLPIGLVVFLVIGGSSLSDQTLSSSSLQQRTTGWDENLKQLQAHPLGVGIGSSGAAAEKAAAASALSSGNLPYQPDNYYFKTIYELGLLGLWMFVLFLIGAFRDTNAIANRLTGSDAALVDGIAAFILAAMAASLVATFFEIFPLDLLFWLVVSVAATMGASPAPEPVASSCAQRAPVPLPGR